MHARAPLPLLSTNFEGFYLNINNLISTFLFHDEYSTSLYVPTYHAAALFPTLERVEHLQKGIGEPIDNDRRLFELLTL